MNLYDFFNESQEIKEGAMKDIHIELSDIVANEDFDALYELFSANTPAGRFVQDMYDDIVIDTGLHPDDDFERIEQIVFDRLADEFGEEGMSENSLNEFAPDQGGGDSDNYFRELASAWYNGAYDSGSLQKGIKTNRDIEKLLQRGIVAPDGKTRKYNIDYNSDFDGVVIYSDDYYEHGDHDDTIDSRTGQKWGPYDFMEFSDEQLDEGVAEQELDEACWKGYHKEGMKTMFGKRYPNCVKNKNESLETYIRKRECPGCGGTMVAEGQLNEKQDACYHKVKSRYKVWPSAYASGALVQCRKKGAANWGNSNESITQEEYDQLDENLKKWFSDKWVRFGPDGKIRGDCARGDDSEGKPKCLPQSKAHSLGKKGRASAASRKRREDPDPERSGKAINVNTKKKSNEGVAEGQRVARKPGQPAGSKKHSDLYTDENPKGTITGLKFATAEDARASVSKIRNSGRSHAHKIQAAVAMEQRARAAGKTEAAAVYRRYINANKKTESVEQVVAEDTVYDLGREYGAPAHQRRPLPRGDKSPRRHPDDPDFMDPDQIRLRADQARVAKANAERRAKKEQGVAEARKKKKKKSSRSLTRYFFPGYGYYGSGDSGEGGGDGGGESKNRGMAEETVAYTDPKAAGAPTKADWAKARTDFDTKYPTQQAYNQRQVELWGQKNPGIPAPTDLTGDTEANRQSQLQTLQQQRQQQVKECAMTEEGAMCPVHGLKECGTAMVYEAVGGIELAEILLKGFDEKYPDLSKQIDRKDLENTVMDAVELAGDIDTMSDVDMMIDDIALEFEFEQEPELASEPIQEPIKENKLYYNVIGTPTNQLRSNFGLRKDANGWYLNEDVSIKRLMTAFRAFGEPTRL